MSTGVGEPATWKPPASASSTTSSTLASSCSAASTRARSTTTSAAAPAATPPIWVDFEPYVPTPCRTSSVSPLITRTASTGRPEPIGDDHRERRLVPLAVREGARAEDRLALRRDLDGPELGLDEPVRDLDVHADADPERARVALVAPPPLLVAQRLVVRRLEREVERPLVVAAVVVARPRRW